MPRAQIGENMNYYELTSFILYFVSVLAVGIWFFVKSKDKGDKDYFLGGRQMNGLVSALSAGASDMSAWILMGLPGSIYMYGLGQVWISIGLLIGTVLAWLFVAPRLRRFSIVADDSITVPQFFQNRFKEKNPLLRVVCAVIFVVAYCIYAASSIKACGTIFSTVMGIDEKIAMVISALVIVAYTLLGGFNAVCWTDFIQGMLMLVALMLVPVVACGVIGNGVKAPDMAVGENYFSFLSSGKFDWTSVASILTGLSWGLGYAGMPHILVRYMAIKNEKEMKRSQILGIVWIALILIMTTVMALVARVYFGAEMESNKEQVFVVLVRRMMSWGAVALIGGFMLAAIVAAAMSTADSQLLASSSSFASDIYKTTIRKNASDKELLWVGRATVAAVTAIALVIALVAGGTSIMSLVSAAWSIFGAAFGPAMILALYWKRFNYKGANAGIITGFVVSVLWMVLFNFEYYGFTSVVANTQIYELLPGFVLSMIAAVVTSILTPKPSDEVVALFDKAKDYRDEEDAVEVQA